MGSKSVVVSEDRAGAEAPGGSCPSTGTSDVAGRLGDSTSSENFYPVQRKTETWESGSHRVWENLSPHSAGGATKDRLQERRQGDSHRAGAKSSRNNGRSHGDANCPEKWPKPWPRLWQQMQTGQNQNAIKVASGKKGFSLRSDSLLSRKMKTWTNLDFANHECMEMLFVTS